MDVKLRQANSLAVLDVDGEIDLSTSPQLRQAILEAFKKGKTRLLVNLLDVRHIDSSGLATLVEGLKLAQQSKGWFGLCGAQRNVRDVFEIAHLDDIFPMYAGEEEALAAQ